MGVNLGAINSKLDAYAKSSVGQKRMNDTILNYVRDSSKRVTARGVTEGGSQIVTQQHMWDIADALVGYIKRAAASCDLPESVMAHIESFEVESAEELSPEVYHVGIKMFDNPRRESVQPEKYEGAYNIVALFNAGYSAKARVYGYWETADENIWTLQRRDGLHFIQEAVAKFNHVYGNVCDVTVFVSSEYE